MKEAAIQKQKKLLDRIKLGSYKILITKLGFFIAGLLVSRGTLLGRYFPFGLAATAAVPNKNLTALAIGAFLGYMTLFQTSSSIRYISTVVAIAAIKWALSDLVKIRTHPIFAPVAVFLPTLFTGIAMDSIDGFEFHSIIMCITEAVIAASAAFFFDRTVKILFDKNKIIFDYQNIVCVLITLFSILLAFSSFEFQNISLGRTIAILLIFVSVSSAGVVGGCISGISSGVIFSLPSFNLMHLSGTYAFSGMISGLFTSFGRLGICFAFLFSSMIVTFPTGDGLRIISSVYEIIIASLLFFMIPKQFINRIKEVINLNLEKLNFANSPNAVVQKLRFASDLFVSFPKVLDDVSQKISTSNVPKIEELCVNSVNKVCKNCSLKLYCWETNRFETEKNFNNLNFLLSKRKEITKKAFSQKFLDRCSKIENIIDYVKSNSNDANSKLEANKRVEEIKKILTNQFDSVMYLFDDIADNLNNQENFDQILSVKIQNKFKNFGINAYNVICKQNNNKKMLINSISTNNFESESQSRKFLKEISTLCGRKFENIIVNKLDCRYRIQMIEKAKFRPEIGVAQHACDDGKFCGDNFTYFFDENGNFVIIISDGMGTGGKALVDGAMTSELIKNLILTGINYEHSIKTVNSLLANNTTEETLTTVDILSFNLYSGEAKFIKAGAPASYVNQKGSFAKIESSSLPIGIFKEVKISCNKMNLNKGDLILMTSDGVTEAVQDNFIEEKLNMNFSEQKIAEDIVNGTVEIRKTTHDDDITAFVVKII